MDGIWLLFFLEVKLPNVLGPVPTGPGLPPFRERLTFLHMRRTRAEQELVQKCPGAAQSAPNPPQVTGPGGLCRAECGGAV